MRSEAHAMRVLDANALRALSAEPNSSKYAIDAHNRSLEEIGDLSELPKLCSLDLSFNRIKNLKNLHTAKELRELKLYNNQLTNTNGLNANTNLEGLFLQENRIQSISADFLALGKLKTLRLNSNRIQCVENLRSCRLLVHLDISRNCLKGTASEGMESLVNLESLNLSGNQLTAIGNLQHMTKLEELNLSINCIAMLEGQFPPNLTVLRINSNQILDLQSLTTTMLKLNELYLQDNSLTNLNAIPTRFPQLESLDISNNRIPSFTHVVDTLCKCESLQDLWVQGNPCCLSGRYFADIVSAIPGLKTLDNLTDVELERHIEGIKSGDVSSHHALPRPATPSSRPGTAASRPRSSSGSRPATPTGRPETPPVFHQPSARIGNLQKMISPVEIQKAENEVFERLQKMKAMLQRVGSNDGPEHNSSTSTRDEITNHNPERSRPVIQKATTITTHLDTTSVSTATTLVTRASDTLGKREAEARYPRSTISASRGVDAGTDPLVPLMGGSDPFSSQGSQNQKDAHEMETQTMLPPAPVSITKEVRDGVNESNHTSKVEDLNPSEPQFDGDLVEQEMKRFLLQHAVSDLLNKNQDAHDVDDLRDSSNNNGPEQFQSPRLDSVRVAEQRKPPTPRSRQGYRSFRMPARPMNSTAV